MTKIMNDKSSEIECDKPSGAQAKEKILDAIAELYKSNGGFMNVDSTSTREFLEISVRFPRPLSGSVTELRQENYLLQFSRLASLMAERAV